MLQPFADVTPLAHPWEAPLTYLALSTVVAGIGWFALFGKSAWEHFTNEMLVTVGLFVAMQFVISFLTSMANNALFSLTLAVPVFTILAGIGNTLVPCTLYGGLFVLEPRRGIGALTLLSLLLLQAVLTGSFHVISAGFTLISCVAIELCLAALLLTKNGGPRIIPPSITVSLVVRMAIAIGTWKGLATYLQFCVSKVATHLPFDDWYVILNTVAAVLFGGLGGGLGVLLGYRLRRAAP